MTHIFLGTLDLVSVIYRWYRLIFGKFDDYITIQEYADNVILKLRHLMIF